MKLLAQHSSAPAIAGDFADPTIISDGKLYYAAGTSSEWAPHYPVFRSSDLQHWEQSGYIFDHAPEWTMSSFWAPEFFKTGSRYLVYYTARRKSDSVSCIGVASSAFPDHGYTDHGVIIDFGKEAIDAFVFDDDGQLFISFKAYGLDKRPIELLAYKLSSDGLHLEGDPFTLIRDEQRAGLEGQSMIKKDGYYYLFYSAGNCCGASCSYNVQVARARNIKGPYERHVGDPLLSEYIGWKCAGHGSFINNTEGDTYYVHHAYSVIDGIYTGRQGMIAKLEWNQQAGWPLFKTNFKPSPALPVGFADDFSGKKPALYWQWDWRHSTPHISQANGKLLLKGTVAPMNPTGIVITIRPAQTTFSVTTEVTPVAHALCGIAYYGDASAAVGVGVSDGKVQCWMTKENQFTVVKEIMYPGKDFIEFKMQVEPRHEVIFYYRVKRGEWNVVNEKAMSIDFLPQWDRSPRPGLHVKGDNPSGIFGSFSISYK
ncbi:MAG: glycoside hydrolase family 43 protein [Chryseolinea sp.]